MVTISTIAFCVRTASRSSNPIQLSHAQQLVAAALGYNSLAAYQASVLELPTLDNAFHFVLDGECLAHRAKELDVPIPFAELAVLISQAFQQCLPSAHLHNLVGDLDDYIRQLVDEGVVNNDAVCSKMAITNGNGIDEIYIPVDDLNLKILPLPGDRFDLKLGGHVSMGIDEERAYFGHKIVIEATLSIKRTGKVSIAEPTIEVTKADLDYGIDDEDQMQTISLAQALANELDIELFEAEELVDTEANENASDDGLLYSYFFDFSRDASPELATKLMDKHGSLSLEVPAWFFDNIEN